MAETKNDKTAPELEKEVTPDDEIEIAPEEPEVCPEEAAETQPEDTAGTAEEEEIETAPEEESETAPEEESGTVPEEESGTVPEETVEAAPEKETGHVPEDDFEIVNRNAKDPAPEKGTGTAPDGKSDSTSEKGPDLAMAVAAGMIARPAAADNSSNKNIAEAPARVTERPAKKSRKGLLIACLILLLIAAGCGTWAMDFWQKHHASTVFFDRTYLYGEDISGRSPDEIASEILKKNDQIMISLTENGEVSAEGSAKDFGLTMDEKKLRDSISTAQRVQADSPAAAFGSLYQDYQITTDEVWNLDENVLNEKINSRNLLVKRTPSYDAYMNFDDENDCAVIVPEIYGNQFKKEDLQAFMKDTLISDFSTGVLSDDSKYTIPFPEDLYRKPAVTKDDPDLNQLCDSYNDYSGTSITYTFGEETLEIPYKDICDMTEVIGNTAILKKESVASYVAAIAEKYDTRGIDRTYISHDGYETEFDGSQIDYGYTIDQEAETEQLYNEILDHAKVSRDPIYDEEDKWGNPYFYSRNGTDDLNGTFIEVSLADQHVWFFKEGKLIVDGDCVTGNLSRKMGTSRGMYPITFKKSPAVLRGGSGKGAYATPVTYWMPFNGGQGLHDATWRGKFGGSIYKSNGSHGCVNLPKSVAATIYENCKPGMCVVVY